MNRYFAFGSISLAAVVGLYFLFSSPSSVENIEDIKNIVKEEKNSQQENNSVSITYDSKPMQESSKQKKYLTVKSDSEATNSSKTEVSSKNSDAYAHSDENLDVKVIENMIGESNLKPVFKKWKKKGKVSYNVFIKSPDKKDSERKILPPALPTFATIKVAGEKIDVVIPGDSEGYVVTKEESEVKYQPLNQAEEENSENIELIMPPSIGN
ncbi:hypothetical protein RZR97_09940 [Hydrogenimonas thermophila]|uniref:hypothetical protein n=1 Tax=Hydrogenimonas thermophila TaxID=223786 RepID=UPI002936DFA2|nr:hypothetical protein [Hydrogenimonas thermophila]WOE69423.1 hypothetical protein RZR91_09970 [Hydrogenimonas thermophila]WOE71932.1 hypothetical protein RZR97_09940 [Hydrogenimonas thermophila]